MQLHSLLAKTADFLNTGFDVAFYLRKQAKNCIDTGSGPEQNKKTEKENFCKAVCLIQAAFFTGKSKQQ